MVNRYRDAGIENILALGGDPPADLDLPPGELHYAVELVELVRGIGDFSIGVAAHPEPHPKSESRETDRYWTAEKLALADFAITQFFFDAAHYFDLVDGLHAHGVDKPVIPGIMPVTNIKSITAHDAAAGLGVPAVARRQAVRRGGRSRRGARGRHRGGHAALSGAARRRRAGPALLHAEPLARDAATSSPASGCAKASADSQPSTTNVAVALVPRSPSATTVKVPGSSPALR